MGGLVVMGGVTVRFLGDVSCFPFLFFVAFSVVFCSWD